MTPLIQRYIKTSFIFLLVGLALGSYITLEVHLRGRGVPWSLVSAHGHLVLVGFVQMLVFGLATWLFPRPGGGDSRYRPSLAEAVYWLLTASTVVRTLGELAAAAAGSRSSALAAVGSLGQVAAGLLFVTNLWSRVRMPGSPASPGGASGASS